MLFRHARRHWLFILLSITTLATLSNLGWYYVQNYLAEPITIAQVKTKPDNKKDCNGCGAAGYEWKWNSQLNECRASNTPCGTDNKPKTDPTKSNTKSECVKPGNYGIWCESTDLAGQKYAFCIDSRENKGCNAVAQEKGYTFDPDKTGLACGSQIGVGETTIGAANKLYICKLVDKKYSYEACNGSNGCSQTDLPTILPTYLSQGTGKATCYVGTIPYPHGRIYEKSANENLQCNNGQLVPINLKAQDVLDSIASTDETKRLAATEKIKALCQAQKAPNCNTDAGLLAFQQSLLTQVLPPSESKPILDEIVANTKKNQEISLVTTFLNDQDITKHEKYAEYLAQCRTQKGSTCSSYELTAFVINLLPESIPAEGGDIKRADLLKELENNKNLSAYNTICAKLEAAETEADQKALLAELRKIPAFTGISADGTTMTINPAQVSSDMLLDLYNQSQVLNVLNTLQNSNLQKATADTNASAVIDRCIRAGNSSRDCLLPYMLEKYALDFLTKTNVATSTLDVPTSDTTTKKVVVSELANQIMLEKQKKALAQSAYAIAIGQTKATRTFIYDQPFQDYCESQVSTNPTACDAQALALLAENYLKTEDPIQYAKLQIVKNPPPQAPTVTNNPISFGGGRARLFRPIAPTTPATNTAYLESQTKVVEDTIRNLLKTTSDIKQGDLITFVSAELLDAGYSSEAIQKATESFCEAGTGQCLYDPIADKFVRIDPLVASNIIPEEYDDVDSIPIEYRQFNSTYQSILNNSGVNKNLTYPNSGNLGQKCRWGDGSLKACNNPLLSCQGGVLGFGSTCQLTEEAQSQIALGMLEQQYTSILADKPLSEKETYELQLKLYNNPLNQPILNSGINASAIATNRLLSANGCGVGRDSYMSQGVCWICLDSTSKSRFQAPDISYCDPDKKEVLLSKIPGRECEVAGGYCADQNTVRISGVTLIGALDCPENGSSKMLCLQYTPPSTYTPKAISESIACKAAGGVCAYQNADQPPDGVTDLGTLDCQQTGNMRVACLQYTPPTTTNASIARRGLNNSCSDKFDEFCANGLICVNNICTSEFHAAFVPEAEAGVWAGNVEKNFSVIPVLNFVAKNVIAPIARSFDTSYYNLSSHQANILTNLGHNLQSDPQALSLLETPEGLTTNINSLMNANALVFAYKQNLDKDVESKTQPDIASANKFHTLANISLFTQSMTGGKDWTSLENEDVVGIGVTIQSLTGDNQYNQSFLNCAAAGGKGAACNAFKLEVVLTAVDVLTPPIPGIDDLITKVGVRGARTFTAKTGALLATREMADVATTIGTKGFIESVSIKGIQGLGRAVTEHGLGKTLTYRGLGVVRSLSDTPRFTAEILLPTVAKPLTQTVSLITRPVSQYAQGAATRLAQNTLLHSATNATTTLTKTVARVVAESSVGLSNRPLKSFLEGFSQSILDLTENQAHKQINNFLASVNPATVVGKTDTELTDLLKAGGITNPTDDYLLKTRQQAAQKLLSQATQNSQSPLSFEELAQVLAQTPRFQGMDQDKIISQLGSIMSNPDLRQPFITKNFDALVKASNVDPELLAKTLSAFDQSTNFLARYDLPINLKTSQAFTNLGQAGLDQATLLPRLTQEIGDAQLANRIARALDLEKIYEPPTFLARLASFNPLARSTTLPPITPISSSLDPIRVSPATTISRSTGKVKINQIRKSWSPEALARPGIPSEIYRLKTTDLSSNLVEQTKKFNTMLDEFESSVGFHLRENQVKILKDQLSILQLEAGGGKSAVITRILSTEDNINFALFKSATEKADYISDQILTPEGIKYHQTRGATVIDIDSQHGFRQIELKAGQAHDVTKAKRLSAGEVEALLSEAATDVSKRVVFVSDRANTIWTRLGGNAQTDLSWWQKLTRQTGETAEGKLIKELTSQNSRFGTSNFVVDEIGDDIIGNFAVSGRGKALKDVKNPDLLGGLTSGQVALKTHREVTGSNTELDKLLKLRLTELGTGQGESSLLTAVGKGQFVPQDELVHARSLSEIIDQSFNANPTNTPITPLRSELRSLQINLKSGDSGKASQAIADFEAMLTNSLNQNQNRQLLTDLAYRKNTLQDSWTQLARVPDTDFALEGGELVLRKAMGTTGERLGKTTQLLPFYDYGPRMLQAFDDYLIQKGSAKQIATFSLDNIPIFGKGTQMSVDSFYQEILSNGHRFKAFDATPDTAAHLLSRQASGISEIISAKPTNFGISTETEDLLTQLVQNRAKPEYSKMATAIVMPDTNPNLSHDLQRLVQLADEQGVGYKQVVVAQYATRPDGIETIEYVSYKVIKDASDNAYFELPPIKLRDLGAWNEHVATALGKGNPEELAIVYLGRPRAVDLKVTEAHLNIRWSHFNDDSLTRSTSETITQEIKRNRLMVEANQALVNATPEQIAKATEYDLYLRVADPSLSTTLTKDNVMQDYFVQNLYTHLGEVRVQALLSNLQLAPSRKLDQLDALLDNLTLTPPQRQAVIRSSQKLQDELSTQTSSFASLMESTISRDPLVGDKLYLELARRGEATNKQLLSMAQTIKNYAGLTDTQLDSLKLALGAVDNFDPIKTSYLDLLKKPSAGLVTPKSQGPADLLLAFAQNNSTDVATSPYYRAAQQSFVASTAEKSAPKAVASTTQRTANVPTGLTPANASNALKNRLSQALNRPPTLSLTPTNRVDLRAVIGASDFESLVFSLPTNLTVVFYADAGKLYTRITPTNDTDNATVMKEFAPEDLGYLTDQVSRIIYNSQDLPTTSLQTPASRQQLADNLAAGNIPPANIPTTLQHLGLTPQDTRALQTHLLAQAQPVTQPAPQPQTPAPTPVAATPPQAPATTAPAPQAQSTSPSFSIISNDGQTLGTLPLNTSLQIDVLVSTDGQNFRSISYSQGNYTTLEEVEKEIARKEATAQTYAIDRSITQLQYYITLEQANNPSSKITYNPEQGHTIQASAIAPKTKTASSFWDQEDSPSAPHPAYNPNTLSFPRGVDVNTGEFSRLVWLLSWNPFSNSPWHQLNTLLSELRAKEEYGATIITKVQALNLSEEVTITILTNLLELPAELTPIVIKLQASPDPSSLSNTELKTIEDALRHEYTTLLEATQRGDFKNYQELQQYYYRQMQKFGYFRNVIDQKVALKRQNDFIEQIMSGYKKYQEDIVEKIKFGITEGTIAVDSSTDFTELVRGYNSFGPGRANLYQQARVNAETHFFDDTVAQVTKVADERIALQEAYLNNLTDLTTHLLNILQTPFEDLPIPTIEAVHALKTTLENRPSLAEDRNFPRDQAARREFQNNILAPVMDNVKNRIDSYVTTPSDQITSYLNEFKSRNDENALVADLAQDQSLLTPEIIPTTPAQSPRNTASLARIATFLDENYITIGEDYSDLLSSRLAERQKARYNPDTLTFPRGVNLNTGEFSSRTYFASFLPFLNTSWHQVNTALANYRQGVTNRADTEKAIASIKGLTEPIQTRVIAHLPSPHHVVNLNYNKGQTFKFNPNHDRPITIGRKRTGNNNTIEYPDAPMTSAISGQHSAIIRESGEWTIQDSNSKTGTQINGQQLTPHTPQPLKSGDVITIGNVTNKILVKVDAQGNLTLTPFMHGATQATINTTSISSHALPQGDKLALPSRLDNLTGKPPSTSFWQDDVVTAERGSDVGNLLRSYNRQSGYNQLTRIIKAYNQGELSPADFLTAIKAIPNNLVSREYREAIGQRVDSDFEIDEELPATASPLVYPDYFPPELIAALETRGSSLTISIETEQGLPISLTHHLTRREFTLDTTSPAQNQQRVVDLIAETVRTHSALFPDSTVTIRTTLNQAGTSPTLYRGQINAQDAIEVFPQARPNLHSRATKLNFNPTPLRITNATTQVRFTTTSNPRLGGIEYEDTINLPTNLTPTQKALLINSHLYSLLIRNDAGHVLYSAITLTTDNPSQRVTVANSDQNLQNSKNDRTRLEKNLAPKNATLQSSPLAALATFGFDSAIPQFFANLLTTLSYSFVNITGGDVGLALRTFQDLTLLWQNADTLFRGFFPRTQTEPVDTSSMTELEQSFYVLQQAQDNTLLDDSNTSVLDIPITISKHPGLDITQLELTFETQESTQEFIRFLNQLRGGGSHPYALDRTEYSVTINHVSLPHLESILHLFKHYQKDPDSLISILPEYSTIVSQHVNLTSNWQNPQLSQDALNGALAPDYPRPDIRSSTYYIADSNQTNTDPHFYLDKPINSIRLAFDKDLNKFIFSVSKYSHSRIVTRVNGSQYHVDQSRALNPGDIITILDGETEIYRFHYKGVHRGVSGTPTPVLSPLKDPSTPIDDQATTPLPPETTTNDLVFDNKVSSPQALGFADQTTLWVGDIISNFFQTIGNIFSRATPEVSIQPVEQIVVTNLNTKALTHTRETVRDAEGNVVKRAATSLSANGRRLTELLFTNNYTSAKELLDLKDNSQVARVLGVSQDEAQALLSQLQDSRTQQLINQSLAGKARSKSEQAIITELIGSPDDLKSIPNSPQSKLFTDLYKELYGNSPSAFQVFTLRQRLLPLARWHADLADTQRPTERELNAILLQGRLPLSLTTRLSITKTDELKELMLSLRSHAPYIINEAQPGATSTITLRQGLSVEELGLVISKLNQEFTWGFQLNPLSNSIYQNILTRPTTDGGLGLTKFEGYKYRKTTVFSPIEVFADRTTSQVNSWLTPTRNLLADFFIDLVGAPIENIWVDKGGRKWAAGVELRIFGYQTGGITREMSRQALVSGFQTGAFWALPGYFGNNGRLAYSVVRITTNLVKNGSNMFAHIFQNLAEANSIQEKTALIALNLTGGTVTFAAQTLNPLAYYAVLIFDTINTNLVNTARNYQITGHLTSSVSFRVMEAFKNGSSVGYLASGLGNSFTTAQQSFFNQDAPAQQIPPTQTATTSPTEIPTEAGATTPTNTPTEVPTQVPTQEPTTIPSTPTTEPTLIPEPEVEEIVKEYATIDDHVVEIITDRAPRVMILGDSISVSIVSGISNILSKEQEVEFVGSAEIHGIAHEGHGSFSTQLFLESLEAGEWRDYSRGVRPDEGAGYANTITKGNAPDIIVIQFGTNDAKAGALGTYRTNIEAIIAHYRELNPHTQIILSRIPNTADTFQDNVVALNRQLYQIAQDMPGVYYTETTQSLNTTTDVGEDGVHLNGSGINTTNAGIIKELNPALDIISPSNDLSNTSSSGQIETSSVTSFEEIALKSARDNIDFGTPLNLYQDILANNIVTDQERRILYEDYYKNAPDAYIGTGTYYGDMGVALGELNFYKEAMRQQMQRGFVLIGSGMYGYHDNKAEEMREYINIFNQQYKSNYDANDTLLDNQSSPMYIYLAGRNLNQYNEPTPIAYEQLNDQQRRLYDITNGNYDHMRSYFVSIEEQSLMTPEEALATEKYIGVVSTKNPNDIGKRLLIFKYDPFTDSNQFVGVVLVNGTAKRSDWIGIGGTTVQDNADFNRFPLGIRKQNNDGMYETQQWGFDLDQNLYQYFGGSGGPVYNVVAVNPDADYQSQSLASITPGDYGVSTSSSAIPNEYGLVYYSQLNDEWSRTLLPNSTTNTIGQAGCGPTVVSMLLSSYSDKHLTPTQVAESLFPEMQSMIDVSLIKKKLSEYGFTFADIRGGAWKIAETLSTVEEPIYIGIKFRMGGVDYTHHSLAVDSNANGELIMYDPFFGQGARISADGTTITSTDGTITKIEIIGAATITPPSGGIALDISLPTFAGN